MAFGYTRQSAGQIVTGASIEASHFNNEYNALQSFADATTGHNHDGTIGGGAKIPSAGLNSLTSTSAGIVAATGSNTFAVRTITAPAAGITVSNGSGASGNPTLALANDLAAVEGLASTGLATRTASDTWAVRTLTGTSNRVSITNGDGVAGNPTIDISSSYVGQNTITTVGTITTGTWNGTAVADSYIASASTWNSKQAGDATLTALAAYNTNGLMTQTAADTFTGRTLTGTTNRITVTNGDGVSGNPTIDVSSSYVGQATITTLGTITTGTWNGTAIGTAYGGVPSGGNTGQILVKNSNTSYDYSWGSSAVPYTAASASGAASIGFAEDTDNGTSVATLQGAAALAGDITITLPAVTSTLSTLAGTETLTNKSLTDPLISAGGGALILPQSASPTPTTEGDIRWDTDDNRIVVGDGAAQQIFYPSVSGTFTPVIEGTTTAGSGTYSAQTGKYTRTANVVTFFIRITWTAHTGTGNMRIATLPFTAGDNSPVNILTDNLTSPASTQVKGLTSGTTILLYSQTIATGTFAALAMDTAGEIYVAGQYLV